MEDIFTVDGESFQQVEEQLQRARDEMIAVRKRSNCTPGGDGRMEFISYSNGSISMNLFQDHIMSEDFGGFALIISGQSLVCDS